MASVSDQTSPRPLALPAASGAPPLFATPWAWATVLTLLALALFLGNATTAVWDQDEAAYAGFARDMLVNDHWTVPDFPNSQPHRKPPLHFWLIAASYTVFGINEFALRLPSTLAILATLAVVAYGGRFLAGRRGAQLAALILATLPFVLTLGKIALTDGVLLLCQTVAALALLRAMVRPAWTMTAILWMAVALGVLAKGPPILILVGGMFLFLLIFHPRRRNLIHLHPWFGLPLALAPLAVWGWLAWQEDQQRYVLFLAWWYILRRAGGSVFGQQGPPGTYFLLLFGLLIPWTTYFLPGLRAAWRGLRRRQHRYVLLASWLFGGWLLWELPTSKLPTYILGAFPPLALLLAQPLAGRLTWSRSRTLRAGATIVLVGTFVAAVAVSAATVLLAAPWARFVGLVPAAALVTTGALVWYFHTRSAPRAALHATLLGTLASYILIWLLVIPGFESQRAVTRRVAQYVAAHVPTATTVIVACPVSAPSLPFYLARAGLAWRELGVTSDDDRPPLVMDWSDLWHLRFASLVRQVQSQSPPPLSPDVAQSGRIAEARMLWHTGTPDALILDESQYADLAPDLAGAHLERFTGWRCDRPASTTYLVALRRR